MERPKRIFVLSGRQGSGKSTYAETLRDFLGKENCAIFKFAKVLYELHDACLPILKGYGIVTADVKKDGELLQVLGTEYGRNCKGENVWVDVTRRWVDSYLAKHSRNFAIIDDCRFENEFDAFHPVAHMIRLQASKEVRQARCSAWRDNDSHASEIGLDDYEENEVFDCVINTELESPKKQVNLMLNSLGYIRV